jgi:outer membrane protein OmpA-like peptidoglycan-associated protein
MEVLVIMQIVMIVITIIFVVFSLRGCYNNNSIEDSEVKLLDIETTLVESNDSKTKVYILEERIEENSWNIVRQDSQVRLLSVEEEKSEAKRVAKEKAEQEQIAKEKAKQERIAKEKAEAERLAKEKAEQKPIIEVTTHKAQEIKIAQVDKVVELNNSSVTIDTIQNIKHIKIPETPKVIELNSSKISLSSIPEVKNVLEFESTKKIQDELKLEILAKEKALSKNRELLKQLDIKIAKERELKNKLTKLTSESQQNQIDAEKDKTVLLNRLNGEIENQKVLKSENKKLAIKLKERIEQIKSIIAQRDKLEKDLNSTKHLKEKNSKLQAKIAKILSTAKEAIAKAQAEHKAEEKKLQLLLSQKQSLEDNLTAELENEKLLKEKNSKLQAKIAKILSTAKEATAKAQAEHKAEEKKLQLLLSQKQSLEANLTAELEQKKALSDKNNELQTKVAELLSIKDRVQSRCNAKQQELLSQKKSLEENLTIELEKGKSISKENSKLQEELKNKKSLEQKLVGELKKERLATASALKLLEELKAQKEEANRVALEAKVKVEELEKEKAKEEAKKLEEQKLKEKQLAEERVIAKKRLLDIFSLTKVEFKINSMNLTTASKARLDKTAEVMKEYSGYRYIIQGHTDNTGNEVYNVTLSGKRANKVKEYLISQGVDASILSTKGFGSSNPIASNDTKEGRLINRRVVFKIIEQ